MTQFNFNSLLFKLALCLIFEVFIAQNTAEHCISVTKGHLRTAFIPILIDD